MQTVQYLQALSGLCWAWAAWKLRHSALRKLKGEPRYHDGLLALPFYFGLLQAGFVLRWVFWHQTIPAMSSPERHAWTALYALCGILALWVLDETRPYRDRQL